MRAIIRTHHGGLERTNQDRAFVEPQHLLAAVLDGEFEDGLAADLAVEVLQDSCALFDRTDASALEASLLRAVRRAHNAIVSHDNAARGRISGTTLTACSPCGDELVVVHVGDSRLYVRGVSSI